MAADATPNPSPQPRPTLLSARTPRAIRDSLICRERDEFERRYAEEMRAAAATLDLSEVLAVLETFRQIAELTQRNGPAAHLRMLDQVDRIQRGEFVVTVPGLEHQAAINARLNR